jgi:hypothetical protein
MGQSANAVVALLMIVFAGAAAIAWGDEEIQVGFDIGFTLAAVGALSVLAYGMFRRDKVPDFLRQVVGTYYERDGFTFAIQPIKKEGICQMAVLFQNRHGEPCDAQVVIKPSREFFMTRRPIPQLAIGIHCEGGAFGVAFVPWGVPKQYHGKRQNLDIGASVRWPHGKGEMLRFRDGIAVKGPKLGAVQIATTIAAAAAGMIVLHTPVRLGIRLPTEVAETVSEESPISIVTLWRPGEPMTNVELPC